MQARGLSEFDPVTAMFWAVSSRGQRRLLWTERQTRGSRATVFLPRGNCPTDIAPFDHKAGIAISANSWRERVVGGTQNDILSSIIRKNPKAVA